MVRRIIPIWNMSRLTSFFAAELIATAIAIPFVTVVVEVLFNELFAVLPPPLVQVVAWFVLVIVYLVIFGALMSFIFGQWT